MMKMMMLHNTSYYVPTTFVEFLLNLVVFAGLLYALNRKYL